MASPPRAQKFQQTNPIVDKEGRPTPEFLRNLNGNVTLLNYLAEIQAAADAATAAAAAANAAADNAQAAADNAQGAADSTAQASALANSYVEGVSISAADAGASATVTISAHDRVYATEPPTTVSVSGGVITGLAYNTLYYFYYDQPSRAGGAVAFQTTTINSNVAQVNDRHSVAAVTTPAAAQPPTNGGGMRPPGGSYDLQ